MNWLKYTYVCNDTDTCDALTEVTSKVKPAFEWCAACGKPLNLISVVDGNAVEVK